MILCEKMYRSQMCCNGPLSVLMEVGMWSWWHMVVVLEMTHWCVYFLQTVMLDRPSNQFIIIWWPCETLGHRFGLIDVCLCNSPHQRKNLLTIYGLVPFTLSSQVQRSCLMFGGLFVAEVDFLFAKMAEDGFWAEVHAMITYFGRRNVWWCLYYYGGLGRLNQ